MGIILVLISGYIMPLSATYAIELKKWVKFRIGSNSIGKTLMIFNVVLAVAVFFLVLSNTAVYENELKTGLKQRALDLVGQISDKVSAETLEEQIEQLVDNNPLLQTYVRWLPLIIAVGFWASLEFLRTLVMSNLAGIFTKILIRNEL